MRSRPFGSGGCTQLLQGMPKSLPDFLSVSYSVKQRWGESQACPDQCLVVLISAQLKCKMELFLSLKILH